MPGKLPGKKKRETFVEIAVFNESRVEGYFLTTLMINQHSLEIRRKRDQENVLLNVPLNSRRKLLLELVLADWFITVEDLALKCSVSEKTIKRDIDFLKKNQILKRTGSRKSVFYEVVQ
jgi:predicted HTH transcriptional regulator